MSSAFHRLAGEFRDTFSHEELDKKVVLEIACGIGIWGHLLRASIDLSGADCYLVGCDGFKPYLQKSRGHTPYDDVVLCDVRKLPFKTQTVDLTLAFEIIEHLDKQEGFIFLTNLQLITRNKVIISTPYGYYVQGAINNNSFERHISSWFKHDFQSRGFTVKTCGFGNEFEIILRKFHLDNLWRIIAKLMLKNEYAGMMLFATKKSKTMKLFGEA